MAGKNHLNGSLLDDAVPVDKKCGGCNKIGGRLFACPLAEALKGSIGEGEETVMCNCCGKCREKCYMES